MAEAVEPDKEASPEELLDRSLDLTEGDYLRRDMPQRVHIIVNPAAGKDQPILKTLNAAMQTAEVEWDLFITKDAGDATRFAREAVDAGADLVIAHGGDGTIMEVATGLLGSQVPMAIIPGGTANVMSMELRIPSDVVEATALALNPEAVIRTVDMGQIDERHFLLRASVGFEASMVEGANRELKDRFGILAYLLSGLQALADPPVARYHLELDGAKVDSEGLTCIIANSGTVGAPGISLAPGIDVSDGLLDVIVVRKADLPSLVSLAATVVVGAPENSKSLLHWQAREIVIQTDPPQNIQSDGEIIGETPITARVIPHAVRIVVPQKGVLPEKENVETEAESNSGEMDGG